MFANNLRKAREMAGLSQTALAEKLGIPRNRITSWEIRRSEPNFETLVRLSAILEVSTDDLLDVPQHSSLRRLPTPVLEIAEQLNHFYPEQIGIVRNLVRAIALENEGKLE